MTTRPGYQRLGAIKVDLQLLALFLHLPDGHEIRAATFDSSDPERIRLIVEGPAMPETPVFDLPPAMELACTLHTHLVKEITTEFKELPRRGGADQS